MEKYSQEELKNLRLIRSSNRCGNHEGCIKISIANTLEHELCKTIIAYSLIKEGKKFFTEAIFTKGRADIFVLNGDVIEILNTETDEEFELKKTYYPEGLNLIKVRAKDVLKEINGIS